MNSMLIIADKEKYQHKEELYIQVRDKEGRIIPDDLLQRLPDVPIGHPYHKEWATRKKSQQRFIRYLQHKEKLPLNILDVGCGNGWLSHRLYLAGHKVTAADLNLAELTQAERVFGTHTDLEWLYADVLADNIIHAPFDIILFAASCQYFSSIQGLVNKIKPLLKAGGEVHFLDSMFYKNSEVPGAQGRTAAYYSSLGFPQMSQYYFHHSREELKNTGFRKMHPGFLQRKKTLEWWMYRNV